MATSTNELAGLKKGAVLLVAYSGRLLKTVFWKYGRGRINMIPITRLKWDKKLWPGTISGYTYPVKCHEIELNSDVKKRYNDLLVAVPAVSIPGLGNQMSSTQGRPAYNPKQALKAQAISVINNIGFANELDVSCLSVDEKVVYDDIISIL